MTPDHYQRLETLFSTAPCNQIYDITYIAREGEGEVILNITPELLHGGGVVHGSIIFKTLDDAATIAGMSLLKDAATLTSTFNIYFIRPIVSGQLRAVGKVIRMGRRQIIAEAIATDADGREIARGSGTFMTVPIK